mgnify:CR=1 FL=1
MKRIAITLLSLSLVALGALLVQGEGMQDEMKMKAHDPMMKSDAMGMQHDTMMEHKTMGMDKYTVPSDAELKQTLTPLQYKVTREEGTEPAFNNAYWDNKAEGIYVDIISGVPLFSSTDKYKSGTGWPSFTKPIDEEALVNREDRSFFMVRNEVRAKLSDAHLGHVFDDGPEPTGLRYCMNSASLRFIPKADLIKEGYGDYLQLFE